MSRYYSSDPENLEPNSPSICASFLRYTWKTITCLFSHITLVTMVVSYCILGAFTFESLEQDHEKEVKRNISRIRQNITDELWKLTSNKTLVLREDKLIVNITDYLKDFERSLLDAITKNGWDGDESTEKVQWSLAGALFYSIIVITTIGYGHIAPKTQWGKVVTIFYAILGIPLMLLCLSNIGDIMATSFRFLYWKICCYVCTKRPKRPKRVRSNRGTLRIPPYHDEMSPTKTQARISQRSRYSDSAPPSKPGPNLRGFPGSSQAPRNFETIVLDAALLSKTPVLCNKYAVEQIDAIGNHLPTTSHRFDRLSERPSRQIPSPGPTRRAKSMPRSNYLEPPREPSPPLSYRDDVESSRSSVRKKRQRDHYNPSPRIMSPLGYGHRNKYLDEPDYDEDYYDDYYDVARVRIKPVPIWLCVFLVVSYIIAGMFLFHAWEEWDYLDAAYFCFITLTTIGFGDLFPAKRVKDGEEFKQNIAFCSLYLLFGIALLAMSFNLVQEEVIANVKRVAKTLGIIKHEEDEDEDE